MICSMVHHFWIRILVQRISLWTFVSVYGFFIGTHPRLKMTQRKIKLFFPAVRKIINSNCIHTWTNFITVSWPDEIWLPDSIFNALLNSFKVTLLLTFLITWQKHNFQWNFRRPTFLIIMFLNVIVVNVNVILCTFNIYNFQLYL